MTRIQIHKPPKAPMAMNTEIIADAILAYPGMAFATAASVLWGARYVYKLKIENDLIKAQDFIGEVRALNKIEDMNDFLEFVAQEERSQVDEVEAELADRQLATMQEKELLHNAEGIMKTSIEMKENFLKDILDNLEDVQDRLGGIEGLDTIINEMNGMKDAFLSTQSQQIDLLLATKQLYELIGQTDEITRNIAREVGA